MRSCLLCLLCPRITSFSGELRSHVRALTSASEVPSSGEVGVMIKGMILLHSALMEHCCLSVPV